MIAHYLKINLILGWLTRRDPIDMRFKLELKKRYKLFLIGFILFSLFSFIHVTNNSSEPIFHSELEDEISTLSRLSTLSAKLEILFLLSSLEICISWRWWSSFSVFLLFLFSTNLWNSFSIRAFSSLLLFL